MDLSHFNFKRILVVLTQKDMRLNILSLIEEQDVDVNIKFADSYLEAAKLINETVFDPYDHVVLNLSVNNRKVKDFIEMIQPSIDKNPSYLIEYTKDGDLSFVELL
ncbi:MAG: hypothetical protein HON90_17710 [Halobacteriovoraceae bacterium]|jgi:hypothetical protein|nr:hypothetical protein [Halobacteriovoraceae bacterium]